MKNRQDTIYFSIVISKEDTTEILIGNCGIHNINWKNRVGETGIVIGENLNSDAGGIIFLQKYKGKPEFEESFYKIKPIK